MERRSTRKQKKENASDFWIMNQLFGIITLEQRVSRAISECNGARSESVRREVEELNRWVARFEQALDAGIQSPLPPTGSGRMPLCA